MNITISQLNPVTNESQIKAYFDLVIDNVITIKKCKLVEGNEGLFMSVPRYKNMENQWQNIIYISDQEVKSNLEAAAIAKYNEAIASKAEVKETKINKANVTIN